MISRVPNAPEPFACTLRSGTRSRLKCAICSMKWWSCSRIGPSAPMVRLLRSLGAGAPVLIVLLRIAQGRALGGEYGGAAVYVAEHSPPGKSGFYTSFIQAGVVGGFILSLTVVLTTKAMLPAGWWEAGWWRFPFLFSILLLAVSLWMRLKLSESPVFLAMRAEGVRARNPFVESFPYPGNIKRMVVALFGIAAGLTVIWYTAMFTVLSFLQTTMRVEETTAQLITGAGALTGLGWFVLFGRLSDRVGRKPPIVIGYVLTLILLFPIFWAIGVAANPGLSRVARPSPVVLAGPACRYSPFAATQSDACRRLRIDFATHTGSLTKARADVTFVSIGGEAVADQSPAGLDAALTAAGYDLAKVRPTAGRIAVILAAILVLGALSGITGYFGGFLPFISQYIVARTGDPFAGLWYTMAVVAMALVVTLVGLKEPRR